MVDPRLTEAVTAVGLAAGLDRVGVASAAPFDATRVELRRRRAQGLHGGMAFTYRNPERSTDPARSVPAAASLVVGARAYLRPPAPAPTTRHGRVARYAWSDSYAPLRGALGKVADHLRAEGWTARVVVDDNALVDRAAAERAGLGWFGKNANLLLPGRGSWFVLGSVITDAPLVPAAGPVGDGCGGCTRCLHGCPTGAIVSPGVVDARRCLAWLVQAPGVFPREHRVALGDRIYGCDDCQEVCPLNRPERPGLEAGPAERPWVDVLSWLAMDDEALLADARHWYVARRDARHLRRNALIVLANTADPDDGGVLAAVAGALAHPDPLVRAHAVWAAARLGRPRLADAMVATEADPMVRAELDARHAVPPRVGVSGA